eukprot:TRINITY_DN44045_c0_g1_i1.p1 TRINITY_DN44045_c0_g1~~TRINITY_DN44045_c0_g1_i1.p1  ORF type:complete len:205 (+),score=39.19 TRINITY_DN44045_c0_g1_i1:62-676(+)
MQDAGPFFKVIVLGESGVGKSALTLRLTDSVFFHDHAPTISMDFRVHAMTVDNQVVRLQVWDTAGQEIFHSLATQFYRSADGVLLCFDLTERRTFHALPRWLERVHEHTSHSPPCVVVGCKSDLRSRRVVAKDDAVAWAAGHRPEGVMGYVETSALEAENVELAFEQIIYAVLEREPLRAFSQPPAAGVSVGSGGSSRRRSGCC